MSHDFTTDESSDTKIVASEVAINLTAYGH